MSRRQIFFLGFLLHVLIYLDCFHCLQATSLGVTVDLIHRDSPQSPFYNPLLTPVERYNNAIHWGRNRMQTLTSTNLASLPGSQVVNDGSQYVMKLALGSPPKDFYGIVDTGSDLTWTQCTPCTSCYNQKYPKFDPTKSSTYKELSCSSQQCQLVQHVCSDPSSNTCDYSYFYGGGSYTFGSLATETLTLIDSSSGEPYPIKDITIGCGHNNTGPSQDQTGIFGLGGGPLSLVSQIGTILGSKKFSHCLVPIQTPSTVSSKFTFGIDANAHSQGDSSVIPLIVKDYPTYYFITLEGFNVGDKFVPFSGDGKAVQKGNMFIDSGTPPMLLPQELYNRMVDELKSAITLKPIPGSPQLCYYSETQISNPIVTAQFEGGVKVTLNPINVFIPVAPGVYCFTMTNVSSDTGIIGNFGQYNFLIGYDLHKKTVSFKATDCTKDMFIPYTSQSIKTVPHWVSLGLLSSAVAVTVL